MSDKITVTTEKDGKVIIFEGSGTLTLTERVGGWVEARPASMSRDARGVEIEWDGVYTVREADRERDTLEELEAAREELEDLRQENDRLERILQSPLSLKVLEVAWEAAEEADECRKGDVLIVPGSWGGYTIWEAVRGSRLRAARVLSRAPKREPWEALADVFKTWDYPVGGYEEELAKWVYAKGVRMTGGDDDD